MVRCAAFALGLVLALPRIGETAVLKWEFTGEIEGTTGSPPGISVGSPFVFTFFTDTSSTNTCLSENPGPNGEPLGGRYSSRAPYGSIVVGGFTDQGRDGAAEVNISSGLCGPPVDSPEYSVAYRLFLQSSFGIAGASFLAPAEPGYPLPKAPGSNLGSVSMIRPFLGSAFGRTTAIVVTTVPAPPASLLTVCGVCAAGLLRRRRRGSGKTVDAVRALIGGMRE